ncbi:MAG: hypothetical protein WCB85_12555 [Candidatus Dormiibacterota bacterium]
MAGLIAVVVVALGIGVLIWWGSGFPPTRPRPGSRHRGTRFLDVDKRLEEEERHHR